MAAIAVFCASDNRFTHLTLCRENLALLSVEWTCSPDELCCADEAAVPAATDLGTLVCDSCVCCSQAPTPHQGEPDARAPIERNPVKVEVLLSLHSTPLTIDQPLVVSDAPLAVARPTGGAVRFLLCNHLRF